MILQTSARMVATSSVAGAIQFDEDETCILAFLQARNAGYIENNSSRTVSHARTIRD
jgi:hypothetical protein